MGTHASMLVLDENGSAPAAFGYEHGDGHTFADELVQFATDRNKTNSWGYRTSDDELWPVTPAEFVTRWAQKTNAEHQRLGRTGAGVDIKLDGVSSRHELGTEYAHLVVVNGTQVLSIRRVHRSEFGAGSCYTVTFDPAPVTHSDADDTPHPSMFKDFPVPA